MKKAKRWIAAIAVGLFAVVVFQVKGFSADETRSLEEKLEQVLANQSLILKALEDVQEGLRIVKVRASS